MKASIIVLILVALAGSVFLIYRPQSKEVGTQLLLGGKTYVVEVANTDATRERGLSGHKPLGDSDGMLFVFDTPGYYAFWMKDMTFPLDIIWMDGDLQVTHIEKSLATSTYPKPFYSGSPSRYVLEIASGQSETINLKIGDRAKILHAGAHSL